MRRRWKVGLTLSWMYAVCAQAALPVALGNGERLPSLAPMLEQATPAVVNIATYATVAVRNPLLEDEFFRRFFNVPRYRRTQSAGSGVVVDAKDGYIVTNHHVVRSADEINITLSDGRVLPATLVGADEQVDLAVLKVDPERLAEIDFADSTELRVGDFVVAIGSPFGLSQTVTSGIVSHLGRTGLGIEGFEDFIQTDASINPGNSGGALVDLNGRLVGINTAIVAPSGGNVGIGFAIPSNMVRAIMHQLIDHGEVRRGYLGLAVQGLNVELAEAFSMERTEGVVVVEVDPESAAEESGLRAGDIITRMGQRDIQQLSDYHSQTAVMFVGDQVDLEVLREGETVRLVMAVADDNLEEVSGRRIDARLAGTELQNFRNADERTLGTGVLVTDIASDSLPYQYGLRAGDILVAANGREVRNLTELRNAARTNQRRLSLRVDRSGRFGSITIISRT